MFRSGGDEPEVELLGEDTVEPGTEVVTTERARTWWPVWLAAAVILGVGITAIASGSGGSGGDAASSDSGDPQEPAANPAPVPETTTTFPPTKVTVLEAGPPGSATEEADPTGDVTTTTTPPAEAVDQLGLEGHLWVWQSRSLHSLDLATGIWEELPAPPASADFWDRGMALTGGGVLLVHGSGTQLLSDTGEVIATRSGQYYAFSTVSDGERAWLTEVIDFSTGATALIEVDAAGGFTEMEPIDAPPLLRNRMNLTPAGGSLFTNPVGAGVYEVLDDRTRKVSNGSLITGGRDALLLIICPDRIADCSLQRFTVATGAYREVEPPPDTNDLWGAWSPDLRYWAHPVVDTAIWDAQGKRWIGEGETTTDLSFAADAARPVWSADNRWVARGIPGQIRLRSAETGARVDVEAPPSGGVGPTATLLFVP